MKSAAPVRVESVSVLAGSSGMKLLQLGEWNYLFTDLVGSGLTN